jgi:hypothetical protein
MRDLPRAAVSAPSTRPSERAAYHVPRAIHLHEPQAPSLLRAPEHLPFRILPLGPLRPAERARAGPLERSGHARLRHPRADRVARARVHEHAHAAREQRAEVRCGRAEPIACVHERCIHAPADERERGR